MIKSEWLEAVNVIEYKNWKYQILAKPTYEYLQISFFEDGEMQYCRKWLLSNDMTASDIIRTAWMATLVAEEHEAREKFRYKGKKIFNPHFNLEKLVDMVGYKENLEIRELAGA